MKITRVFFKTITLQFYRDNTGFFFVVAFLAAGFLRVEEHILIAKMAISSHSILLLIIVLWMIYVVRVGFYVMLQVATPKNNVIKNSEHATLGRQYLEWFIVQFALCFPVFIYAVFLNTYAVLNNELGSFLIILLFVLTILFTPLFIYVRLIKKVQSERKRNRIVKWMDSKFTKPYSIWFLLHLVRTQPLTLILSKLFVFLVLLAFITFTNSGDYDWRVIAVGVVFGLIGNITIIDAYHRFVNVKLALFRNLPVPAFVRIKNWVITFFLLVIPEIIVLIRHFTFQNEVDKLVGLILLMVSFPLAIVAYQHMDNIDKEELIKAGFAVSMLFFFLTLFSVHPFILAGLCLVLCVGILLRYYHYISSR